MDQDTLQAKWKKIVAMAWMDEAFKAELLKDPAAVLGANGIALPSGKTVKIVEADQNEAVFILPPMAEHGELKDDEERIAAVCHW